MATMADIADKAGVSISTVSYVLNGTRPVSAATRARVEAVIAELGYRPHAAARALVTRRTRTIALLVPPLDEGEVEIQMEFVSAVARAAGAMDYNLLFSAAADERAEIDRIQAEGLVEGVILMEVQVSDPRIRQLRKHKLPVVAIGHPERPGTLSYVDIDFDETLARCVHRLADLGHRSIAYLGKPEAMLRMGYGPAVRALRGFTAGCEETEVTGVPLSPEQTPEAGVAAVETLLATRPDVTGLVAFNDAATIGALDALRTAGRCVPDDVSVIALAPARFGQLSTPRLTTADVPSSEMGQNAVALLLDSLERRSRSSHVIMLHPEITERGSCAPAPDPSTAPQAPVTPAAPAITSTSTQTARRSTP